MAFGPMAISTSPGVASAAIEFLGGGGAGVSGGGVSVGARLCNRRGARMLDDGLLGGSGFFTGVGLLPLRSIFTPQFEQRTTFRLASVSKRDLHPGHSIILGISVVQIEA